MKLFTRKTLSIFLAVVLVFALSVTAFADSAWPSFQNTNTNNGVIAAQPPITAPATKTVPLPQGASVYSGVDAAQVINTAPYTDASGQTSTKTIAYTLYDGGVVSGTDGGARVAAVDTDITVPAANSVLWSRQLNATTNFQISTPYLDVAANKLYAGVTHDTMLYDFKGFRGWTQDGNADIDATTGVATFHRNGMGSITTNISLASPVHTLYLPTNINVPAGTLGGVAFLVVLFSPSSFAEYILEEDVLMPDTTGTYVTYNGAEIPSGNYELQILMLTTTADVTISTLQITRYDWDLYSIENVNTANPTVSVSLASGEGQFNTPISYDDHYIYFGIWGGVRSYYQYAKLGGALAKFDADDNFYGAGAVSVLGTVFFGSDSARLYSRDANNFSTTGDVTNLPSAGRVRSSIAYDGNISLYFTSQGDGTLGNLWRITFGEEPVSLSLELDKNSTSTPVISKNGYVYVGYYVAGVYPGEGGVHAFPATFTKETDSVEIYSGDPVQSSPIVYSDEDNEIDYVYFTTNADHSYDDPPVTNHNGYCYSVDVSSSPPVPAPAPAWNPALGGTYALQGFASDSGYLVYGDDSNTLYIFH
jgi:hypothetical protein